MSLKIKKVHLVPGLGAYYREDIRHLQNRSVSVLERYTTKGTHQEFVRMPSEVLSIGIEVDKQVYWGDAVGVAFSGKSGRENASSAEVLAKKLKTKLSDLLVGKTISSYRATWKKIDDKARKLPLSVQYGISQSILAAVSGTQKKTMTEVFYEEWKLPLPEKAPPFHGSCGSDRFHAALKMMIHRLPSHPAGQGDDLGEVLGKDGEALLKYARWWKEKVKSIGSDYKPTFHFDLHGLFSQLFGDDTLALAQYLVTLQETLAPFKVRIESPFLAESFDAQIAYYGKLSQALKKSKCSVQIVADEWANTLSDIDTFLEESQVDWIHIKMPDLGPIHDSLEAVLHCKSKGVGALLGGSCIETMTSSIASYHLALATQPDLMMLKPGMGFDEALSTAHNEMARTLSLLHA